MVSRRTSHATIYMLCGKNHGMDAVGWSHRGCDLSSDVWLVRTIGVEDMFLVEIVDVGVASRAQVGLLKAVDRNWSSDIVGGRICLYCPVFSLRRRVFQVRECDFQRIVSNIIHESSFFCFFLDMFCSFGRVLAVSYSDDGPRQLLCMLVIVKRRHYERE